MPPCAGHRDDRSMRRQRGCQWSARAESSAVVVGPRTGEPSPVVFRPLGKPPCSNDYVTDGPPQRATASGGEGIGWLSRQPGQSVYQKRCRFFIAKALSGDLGTWLLLLLKRSSGGRELEMPCSCGPGDRLAVVHRCGR